MKQDQILDQTKYEYWNGSIRSMNKPSAATPILPGKTTSIFGFFKSTTYPSVSEMSVQYNQYEQKYVVLYAEGATSVGRSSRRRIRTATGGSPTAPS